MPLAVRNDPGLSEGTYVELVRSLFMTLMPTAIMGTLFIATTMFIADSDADPALTILAVSGGILSLLRVTILLFSENGGVAIHMLKRII